MTVIIRQGTQDQYTNTIVLGAGMRADQTTDGLPLLSAGTEVYVAPSGGDDTVALKNAMYKSNRVRLAPGTFTISDVIDIPEGVIVSGAGSGTGSQGGTSMTKIVVGNITQPAIRFGDTTQFAALESVRIVGPGKTVGTKSAIMGARSGSGVAIARRYRFRDVHIEEFGEFAMLFVNCAEVEIENVTVKNTKYGITLKGGGSHRVSTTRFQGCETGLILDIGVTGVVADACEAEDCATPFKVVSGVGIVLNGCVARASRGKSLEINGADGVTVNAFRSDNSTSAVFLNTPHLAVNAGATNVQVNGFTRVNSALGTVTVEADVSAAGEVVLVGAHNFDTTKVTSGGRFGELAFTALP